MTVPPEAITAAYDAFHMLPAGASVLDYEVTDAIRAALEAAAPLIAAAERDRIRKLAEQHKALCTDKPTNKPDTYTGSEHWFADLLEEPSP